MDFEFRTLYIWNLEDVVEIIEGNELKQAPRAPFESNTIDNQAVLDRK